MEKHNYQLSLKQGGTMEDKCRTERQNLHADRHNINMLITNEQTQHSLRNPRKAENGNEHRQQRHTKCT